MFNIIDIKTSEVITTRKTLKAASNYCSKLDMQYGAVRYVYRRVS